MMTLVHFDEAMIHLNAIFSLVISRCNITFSVFWFSQCSAATLIKWGGWSSYCYTCHSFLNLSLKTALKSVNFFTKLQTKISWQLFIAHSVIATHALRILRKHILANLSEVRELDRFQITEVIFKVTQGHCYWRQSIGHMLFPISLPL